MSEQKILRYLAKRGPLTARRLGQLLHASSVDVQPMLIGLVAQGKIIAVPSTQQRTNVYQLADDTRSDGDVIEIAHLCAQWIQSKSVASFTKREISSGIRGQTRELVAIPETVDAALEILVGQGVLQKHASSEKRRGRPSQAYVVVASSPKEEEAEEIPIAPVLLASPAPVVVEHPRLDALIRRILREQQHITPEYVMRSRAMQAIAVRLDTALQGDDSTLRSVVSEVLATLDDLILWQDDAT